MAAAIAGRAGYQPNLLLKNHHAVEFFDGVLDQLLGSVVILYIHRHPVDVMVSLWRLIHGLRWREGPRSPTALDFDRWAKHVEGWAAASGGRPRLVVVRYDALLNDYERTVRGLAGVLGAPSGTFQRPSRNRHVVTAAAPDHLPEPDREALARLATEEVGSTMRAFGHA